MPRKASSMLAWPMTASGAVPARLAGIRMDWMLRTSSSSTGMPVAGVNRSSMICRRIWLWSRPVPIHTVTGATPAPVADSPP